MSITRATRPSSWRFKKMNELYFSRHAKLTDLRLTLKVCEYNQTIMPWWICKTWLVLMKDNGPFVGKGLPLRLFFSVSVSAISRYFSKTILLSESAMTYGKLEIEKSGQNSKIELKIVFLTDRDWFITARKKYLGDLNLDLGKRKKCRKSWKSAGFIPSSYFNVFSSYVLLSENLEGP